MAIADIIQSGKYGIYHVANEGYCSWYEFAQRIFNRMGKKIDVIPVSSKDYPAKAKRPLNSRLNKSSMYSNGFEALPTWEDALDRFLAEYIK